MSDSDATIINSPQYESCLQRLSLLEEALLSQDPKMKDHLKEIHRMLISHEELVHLLKDEDIAKVMAAQQVVTNTVLIGASSGKGKTASVNKKAAAIGMGDL